jgi:hypothetical protein
LSRLAGSDDAASITVLLILTPTDAADGDDDGGFGSPVIVVRRVARVGNEETAAGVTATQQVVELMISQMDCANHLKTYTCFHWWFPFLVWRSKGGWAPWYSVAAEALWFEVVIITSLVG